LRISSTALLRSEFASSSKESGVSSSTSSPLELLDHGIEDYVSQSLDGNMKLLEKCIYQPASTLQISEFCINLVSNETVVERDIQRFLSRLNEHNSSSSDDETSADSSRFNVTDVLCHRCHIPLFSKANINDVSFLSHQVVDTTKSFIHDGLAIVNDVFANRQDNFTMIAGKVNKHIEELLRKVDSLPMGSPVRFKEIMKRGENRYDASLDDEFFSQTCLSSEAIKENKWFESIRAILDKKSDPLPADSTFPYVPSVSTTAHHPVPQLSLPTIIKRGVVFSRPGAERQVVSICHCHILLVDVIFILLLIV
jgi:hypothetical protein